MAKYGLKILPFQYKNLSFDLPTKKILPPQSYLRHTHWEFRLHNVQSQVEQRVRISLPTERHQPARKELSIVI